jgi:PHD/YefM family antitoxin component YafN of YafNO toxin-antitoxin module
VINLEEIQSLTEFQRNTKEHLVRLKKTGQPLVLTVNGRAELVVQDALAYQKLLDALEHAENMAAIRRGVEDIKAGRTRPFVEVIKELEERYERGDLRRRKR